MADERTPLVQTVVVTRRSPRYSHSTFRRFCTILLTCCLIIVAIGFLIPFTLIPRNRHRNRPHRPWHPPYAQLQSWPHSPSLSFTELQDILLQTPDPATARSWSQYYTAGPHLAGKNLSQAIWTKDRWEEFGVQSEIIAYDIYINYPVDHRLALYTKDNLTYECALEEDVLDEDPTSGLDDRVPTFHGYSATGNVTAPYVFVNFGTFWDFEDLVQANVTLKGKIALAKYGRNFRGLKVKRAQELGMVGVVMYSDPQEDGNMTETNGYKAYPDGPARNPSSVQRGSTQYISVFPGDPTTPGYPSKPGVPRTDPIDTLPQIPSLPISYQDALPLLKALNGYGPKASDLSGYWQGGGLKHKGVDYNIGPTPTDVVLNLYNEQEYVTTPIWNVIGIINGTIPDEVVILGNHRDAWIAGGAGDPNSGSAALNEVIRSFGQALAAGWKPLRTIVFASWDGEEYGLLGSTEWVEEYIPWLSKSAVAYLNVDVGARGSSFKASAAPLLNKLIYNVTAMVTSPQGGMVSDHWDGYISTMGSGSDFTAFQDFAGISSLDLGFGADEGDAVYHYHSNYDSFHWMDTQGDPQWEHHATMAQVWALIAAKLSETPVLPFNATDYATGLQGYLSKLKEKATKSSSINISNETDTDTLKESFSFAPLEALATQLLTSATNFDLYTSQLSSSLAQSLPWWKFWKRLQLYYQIRKVNEKYKLLERQFLYPAGLDHRPWFKHVVFAPGRWTGYAGATFPGLVESFEDGNLTNAWKWSGVVEGRLRAARELLEEGL